MQGPRHLPTYLDVVTFENEIDRHHRRLGEIQKGALKRKNIEKEPLNNKIDGGRDKILKFHNSEKALAIERDNELLLGRLVEISRKRQNPLFPLKEKDHVSKSLNSNFRKKEKDRIAAENEAFARRLLSQQPSFNRRKLDVDYDRHSERVRLMQKAVSYTNNKNIRLPPIQYHKYEDIDVSRKSQSGKEKRNIKDLGKKKRRKSQKIDKLTEDEKEDLAEQEEQREKEESERLLREARENREREENEKKEKEAKEQEMQKFFEEKKHQREQQEKEGKEQEMQKFFEEKKQQQEQQEKEGKEQEMQKFFEEKKQQQEEQEKAEQLKKKEEEDAQKANNP